MGVRITADENVVALFDSVSGIAFGPTMSGSEEAQMFLDFVARESDDKDPRSMTASELDDLYTRFRKEEWDEDE